MKLTFDDDADKRSSISFPQSDHLDAIPSKRRRKGLRKWTNERMER